MTPDKPQKLNLIVF